MINRDELLFYYGEIRKAYEETKAKKMSAALINKKRTLSEKF